VATEEFSQIIKLCIQVDPSKRPSASEIAGTSKLLRGSNDRIEIPKTPTEHKEGNNEAMNMNIEKILIISFRHQIFFKIFHIIRFCFLYMKIKPKAISQ